MSNQKLKKIGIIPARYASTRFPGKPLVQIHGKSMIQRVYEQAIKSELDSVIVATDDLRIFEHVADFEGNVLFTAGTHLTGTDRCYEVAANLPFDCIIINIQGDEPFINPEQINELLRVFDRKKSITIATQCKLITSNELIFDANVVKVVKNTKGFAMYFSRNPIPYVRNARQEDWVQHQKHYKHIGIYGFRKSVLKKLAALPSGVLESAESLEQLRWLENGHRIFVAETNYETFGIDVPEDLDKIVF